MDVSRRNLSEVKKLFEERRKRKPEPRIELLLRKIDSVVCNFLCGYGLPVHKLKGNTVQNAETLTKLRLVQLVNRLLRVCLPGSFFPLGPTALDEATSFFTGMLKRGAEMEPAWRNANNQKEKPGPITLRAKKSPEGLKQLKP